MWRHRRALSRAALLLPSPFQGWAVPCLLQIFQHRESCPAPAASGGLKSQNFHRERLLSCAGPKNISGAAGAPCRGGLCPVFPWHREEFCGMQLPAGSWRLLHPAQREGKVLRLWRSSGSFWCISECGIWRSASGEGPPQRCESKEIPPW